MLADQAAAFQALVERRWVISGQLPI